MEPLINADDLTGEAPSEFYWKKLIQTKAVVLSKALNPEDEKLISEYNKEQEEKVMKNDVILAQVEIMVKEMREKLGIPIPQNIVGQQSSTPIDEDEETIAEDPSGDAPCEPFWKKLAVTIVVAVKKAEEEKRKREEKKKDLKQKIEKQDTRFDDAWALVKVMEEENGKAGEDACRALREYLEKVHPNDAYSPPRKNPLPSPLTRDDENKK